MGIYKIRKMWFVGMVIMMIVLGKEALVWGQAEKKSEMTDAEKKREKIQQIKENFNNTAWGIELRRTDSAGKQATEKDIIRFVGYKIVSDKMESHGFNPTNFSIRFKGPNGEVTIWETMQTSEKEGKAFWRGELRKSGLTGALSWQINENKRYDYSYTGKLIDLTPKVEEKAVDEEISHEGVIENSEDLTPKNVEKTVAETKSPDSEEKKLKSKDRKGRAGKRRR